MTSAVTTAIPTTVSIDHAPFGPLVMVLPDADASRADRPRLLVDPEPRRVLVDEQLTVEVEVVGVRLEEALDVRLAREDVEALRLQRPQVLGRGSSSLARPRRSRCPSEGGLRGGWFRSRTFAVDSTEELSQRTGSTEHRRRAPILSSRRSRARERRATSPPAPCPLPRSGRASAAPSRDRGGRGRSRRRRAAAASAADAHDCTSVSSSKYCEAAIASGTIATATTPTTSDRGGARIPRARQLHRRHCLT